MNEGKMTYHRPNSPWHCGNPAKDCDGCDGPTRRGKCTAIASCQPLQHGDAWVCTRNPEEGGPCFDGPRADGQCCLGPANCRPRRTLRYYRKAFTIAMTSLTLGLVILVFSSPWQKEIIAPGPMTHHHAQILTLQGSDRCASCHSAADKNLAALAVDAITGGQGSHCQSELCMNCHNKTLNADRAMLAHNADPNQLNRLTAKAESRGSKQFSLVSFGKSEDTENRFGDIACSTCHREHHGADFNLSRLTDRQCQTCHASTIHRFETDHPEFNYDSKRRSRIAFDHASHFQKHFPDKQTEFDCRQCHVGDSYDNVQQVRSFEQSCAKCHEEQIVQSGDNGMTFLSLPMLDLDSIAEKGFDVGTWPEQAIGDFDGQIPPLMKLLLMADPDVAQAFDQFDSDFQFADVDPDDEGQVGSACKIVWGIKRLVRDLAANPSITVRNRLGSLSDTSVAELEIERLVESFDPQILQAVQRDWLPNLSEELTDEPLPPSRSPKQKAATPINRASLVGYLLNREEDDPEAQQREPLAENPLANIFKPESSSPPLAPQGDPPANQNGNPPTAATESGFPTDMLQGVTENPPAEATKNQQDDTAPNHRDGRETLAINPLADIHQNVVPKDVPTPDSAASANVIQKPLPPTKKLDPPVTVPNDGFPQPQQTKLPDKQRLGNWIKDNVALSISYQIQLHEDPFLQRWIDALGKIHSDAGTPQPVSTAFNALTEVSRAGSCGRCHTVDSGFEGSLTTNWSPIFRDPSVRQFTRFSHQPHLIQPQTSDCTSCHQLDLTRNTATQFASRDPHPWTGNFLPITKSTCAACHHENGASNRCTECHNYHVGSKVISK